jgi:uncharacterized protein YycO
MLKRKFKTRFTLFGIMKVVPLVLSLMIVLTSCSQVQETEFQFQEGDIILQSLNSVQCQAVKSATNSEYSHCGIVIHDGDKLVIYEAVGPVKKTGIEAFTSSGTNGEYTVMRSKSIGADLASMRTYCNGELGKPYDIYFNWDDTEIYCSEFVWKAYEAVGIEVCPTRPLKDYNLTDPIVKHTMDQRYGSNIPYDEPMVAPSDLFESSQLEIVYNSVK